jgi:hypothetical protein
MKKEQSDQDKKIEAINAKVNKSIGALTAVTFIMPFIIRYLGSK